MTGSNPAETAAHRPGRARYRADIEGLRAIAVLLVVVYHAGVPGLSGGFAGVDVFFVVSGFVITTALLREFESTGGIRLGTFYARRARRLLPASAVVLAVTALGSWLWAPRVQWATIGGDIAGSAAYLVNWIFARRAVDYLAQDTDVSPVQHFWSLAVEEQFYLVWPVLVLALAAWSVRRARAGRSGAHRVRRTAGVRVALGAGLTVLVVLPSLGYAFALTGHDPAAAFFVTTTRLWELGLGALIALGAGLWARLPRAAAALLGWAGLAALLATAPVVSAATAWPAPGALLPTVATAAVIVAGFGAGAQGPVWLLGRLPLVWLGGLSYSLYLWHWPILLFAGWRFGELTPTQGLLCVVVSIIPAWLSLRWVENPVRYSTQLARSARATLAVAVCLTVSGIAAGLLLWGAGRAGVTQGSTGETQIPGLDVTDTAAVQQPPTAAQVADLPVLFPQITPDPLRATQDVPDLYDTDCQPELSSDEAIRCERGDPDGSVTLAVVGDSKIAQWMPALDLIGREYGWRIISYTKSACPLTDATVWNEDGQEYRACRQWGREVVAELVATPAAQRPVAVLTSSSRSEAGPTGGDLSAAHLQQGYQQVWRQLVAADIGVIALSDTPPNGVPGSQTVYGCVAEHLQDPQQCQWPYHRSLGSQVLQAATEQVEGATFIDIDPWLCPSGQCPAVYRNVLTYRQGSHITATFALVMAPALAGQLVPVLEDLVQTR